MSEWAVGFLVRSSAGCACGCLQLGNLPTVCGETQTSSWSHGICTIIKETHRGLNGLQLRSIQGVWSLVVTFVFIHGQLFTLVVAVVVLASTWL